MRNEGKLVIIKSRRKICELRRELQIAERNEGRADERGTSTEANAVVKDAGKEDRKLTQQKQAVAGKDKTERGADRGVRTV